MIKTKGSPASGAHDEMADPVLAMLGVGKEIWEPEPGDCFIERLRSETPVDPPVFKRATSGQTVLEAVWRRIKAHQGEEFRTATELPFTYKVEGAGIWFYREGRRINRKLARTQLEVGISRCPLRSTTEIKDLMDYEYLFGMLTDARIRAKAW